MKRKCLSLFMAMLLLGASLCPAAPLAPAAQPAPAESQWRGKRVAVLGDSISDKRRIGTAKCYWEYLAESLGIVPLVYAVNGNQWDGILQQAKRLLAEEGADGVDAILVFAGTNDYNAGLPLGEWYCVDEDSVEVAGPRMEARLHRTPLMGQGTFRGRINCAMDFLKSNFPEAQIVLMTPIHRGLARFNDKNIQPPESYPNKIGHFVEEYVEAVRQAGWVWAVPVIDLYSLCGLLPTNEQHLRYFHKSDTDQLHPNALGHRRMAQTIHYQLLALPATFKMGE